MRKGPHLLNHQFNPSAWRQQLNFRLKKKKKKSKLINKPLLPGLVPSVFFLPPLDYGFKVPKIMQSSSWQFAASATTCFII